MMRFRFHDWGVLLGPALPQAFSPNVHRRGTEHSGVASTVWFALAPVLEGRPFVWSLVTMRLLNLPN